MAKKKKPSSFLVTALKKAVESITTVHGVGNFTNNIDKGRVLWYMLLIANLLITTAFIVVVKQKYDDDQIVTKIYANCKVNQVPFPAVSICNFNLVSVRESRNIENLLKNHNRSQDEIYEFFQALTLLKTYGENSGKVKTFDDILNILKGHYYNIDTIMEEVHQKCEHLVLYCSFNRRVKECSNIFVLIKTYEGHCCTFNYAALADGSENLIFDEDSDMEYFEDDSEDKAASIKMVATSESGRMSGLFVVFNVEPDDYLTLLPFNGAKILLTDPNDYPETTILYKFISPGESVDLKVEPQVYQTENALRRVQVSKRGCWFHDEVILEHTDRYSYETCITECKMYTYFKQCNCIPYKYPRDAGVRICEFKDLECIHNVRVYISREDMKCNPVCYLECSDKKYSMLTDTVTLESENLPSNITKGLKHLSSLRVYFGKSTCNCYKLGLLMDLNYFIATYGGVFSLSFGGSIITLIELTYLFVNFILSLFSHLLGKLTRK